MRFEIDIPTDILAALREGNGRKRLKQRFGFSEVQARYYHYAFQEIQQRRPVFVIGDVHVPYHNKPAYEVVLTYMQALNPQMIILLGDFADFYKISHWAKDPARMSFRDELKCIRAELRRLNQLFPGARKVYVLGNHEERLLLYLWQKCPEIAGLDVVTVPTLLQLEDCDFEFVDTVSLLEEGNPPFQFGGYAFIHGHETRTRGGVNVPRNIMARTNMPTVSAHHHKTDQHSPKNLLGNYINSYGVGCLCRLSERYLPANSWNNGFLEMFPRQNHPTLVKNRRVINLEIV